jgi:UDP-N-acetylmuramoyl-tripeptide--D-alanyl-D-alanine ligase
MMRDLGLSEIAAALGQPPPVAEVALCGVSTDSRTIARGELFVALAGERFDGHAFVGEVERRGAAALLCSRAVRATVPVLQVADTERALGAVARLHRDLFTGTLVALTGSAGKTTTKEMIAAILARAGRVHATRGNLNNEIGVPLTLFGLEPGVRYAVIEMGAGKPGDIAYLAGIARPDVALVTNALPAHLERLGSLDEVARTKGALYEALPATGTAVLNVDDSFAPQWRARIGTRPLVRVSARGAPEADVRALDVTVERGHARFTLEFAGARIPIVLGIPGVQQVANAVAAAGVALAAGLGEAEVRAGLEGLRAMAGRMQHALTATGCTLIDDTYNANPGSAMAAIDTLASFPGTRVLVMGNMAELGAGAAQLHEAVGAHARARGIEKLLVTGPHATAMARGFGAGAEVFATREALLAACRAHDRAGLVMLVKGSRSAGMEAVVAAMLDGLPGAIPAGVR